jgi:hypothetical protein
MPQPPEKKPPFVQTDIASIVCRHCGGKARLVRREPLASDEEGEMSPDVIFSIGTAILMRGPCPNLENYCSMRNARRVPLLAL